MFNSDENGQASETVEDNKFTKEKAGKKTPLDYFSLMIATCGVGYLPLAPGTWGSAVGVLIYFLVRANESDLMRSFSQIGYSNEKIASYICAINSAAFLLFCFLGIRVSGRTAKIRETKDPQIVVIDEVMGQLTVFLFVPFGISWKLILAGFVLFRAFDIWKPYPVNSLENLPSGLGICADDILAGIYGGVCLAVIYAFSLSF